MSIAHRITKFAAVVACGGMLVGCVSQQTYDETETSARSLQARNQELLQENQSLQAMVEQKDAEIASLQSERNQLSGRVENLDSKISGLKGNFSSLDSRLQRMRVGLNPATDRALRQLAETHPNLISYAPDLGMVQFGSDLTFASGSDQVKSEAVEGLGQLARILQTSDAGEYDLRVVGHTDSQKPGKSRDRFPTNRHLSVARAIAVSNVLQSAGVPGERIEVVGWGQYRPAVANNPRGGTAANRRVEIFLVPSSMGEYRQQPATDIQPVDANEDSRDYPMK